MDYRLCITWIIYQQLWSFKVEEKLHLGLREQTRLKATDLDKKLTISVSLGTKTYDNTGLP
jgi:hypothetical protein